MTSTDRKVHLRSSVTPQPLVHRWYAWPYLVAPHTGALNLRERVIPALRNYLQAPEQHAQALAMPSMYGSPFVDPGPAGPAGIQALLDATLEAGRARLRLADDIDRLRALLDERARGGSLESMYADVPDALRGLVELVYDTAHRPSFRFFETLLYRGTVFEPHAQCVSITAVPDRAQPFVYSSPILPREDRLDLAVPFASPVWDDLFASRLHPADARELSERLGLDAAAWPGFAALFTDAEPARAEPVDAEAVRVRFFGHAAVLVETAGSAVLMDPLIGYTDDGHDHFTIADLPARIDAVVISHFHSDHFSLETLLQLRTRIGAIVVPRSSGGSLADPSLKVMLEALGFRNVHELGEMESLRVADDAEVTALPFLGEHADLDIRTKMVPLVRSGGRGFLFATDITPLEPRLFDLVRDELGTIDALFIGLECVGAPLSWLYGPLMQSRLPRDQDQSRRLRGSDAAMADVLARQTRSGRVFAYAMGLEPWLKHLTGSEFEADSEQVRQAGLLTEIGKQQGYSAELLYKKAEFVWARQR